MSELAICDFCHVKEDYLPGQCVICVLKEEILELNSRLASLEYLLSEREHMKDRESE